MSGHFITFEGGEGAGKTSAIKVLGEKLTKLGYDVLLTREPGGIPIAEEIRSVILNRAHTNMDGRTEALLYAAARRQHIVEKVLPALESGQIVLCDRFIDSSLAYQGHARGLGIDAVYQINQFAIQACMPKLTLFFNIDPIRGLERIAANDTREVNRLDMEAIEFHELVYEGFLQLAKSYPERIKTIDADQSFEQVVTAALQVITGYLNKG